MPDSSSTETPEFLAMNPNAMVPVLQDGDLVLRESNAIWRYAFMALVRQSPAQPS